MDLSWLSRFGVVAESVEAGVGPAFVAFVVAVAAAVAGAAVVGYSWRRW